MYKTVFNMGTITNAMRGKTILDRYGFVCSVSRVTDRAKREGCGYSILLTGDAAQAELLLKQNGLRIRSIQRADGLS